jgi:hypothetical protein
MILGDSVAELNSEVTNLFNSRGQGGNFQVDAEGLEPINLSRVHAITLHTTRQPEVYIKQTKFLVNENETWMQVSERMAAK